MYLCQGASLWSVQRFEIGAQNWVNQSKQKKTGLNLRKSNAYFLHIFVRYLQKQPLELLCKKGCYLKFRKVYRKTHMPENIFNKVASLFLLKLQALGFKKNLWHRCFPVNFSKNTFLQNTSRRLLLYLLFRK